MIFGKVYLTSQTELFRIIQLMLAHEIDWLNACHQKVYNGLASLLNDAEKAWLKEKRQAL